ncbi:MAG: STAS domain-containing protein [Terriglobia bacterium]|jgi:anti-anti-sigma regulatory factor
MSRELGIKEEGNHLTLSGVLAIDHGQELGEVLSGVIARSQQVFVSLAEVEDVDTASLQLLYAARTEALHENKDFIWTEISTACGDNAALAGMSRFLGFPEPTDSSHPE